MVINYRHNSEVPSCWKCADSRRSIKYTVVIGGILWNHAVFLSAVQYKINAAVIYVLNLTRTFSFLVFISYWMYHRKSKLSDKLLIEAAHQSWNSKMPGYGLKFVDKVRKRHQCPLCHLPIKDPVQITTCKHRFCDDCLQDFLGWVHESK